ncbi:hypothetical protein ABZ638_22080 [Streptomyces sp. NPDC007107]|uniref:hypothetical protein n=1 Tax=Streptomyces sp. NPDC007107 TaxID=3156915 RepID=UPI003401C68D
MTGPDTSAETQLEAFTQALCDELLQRPEPFVIVTCDATLSFRLGRFAQLHPEHVVDVGIAEATAVAAAFGLARAGLRVVVAGFAAFLSLRALEPLRSLVALHRADVTVLAGMTGLSAGRDGVQHQATEDAALVRAVPGVEIVAPSDAASARALAAHCAANPGPRWVRLVRRPVTLRHVASDTSRVWPPARWLAQGDGSVLLCAHGALCEQAEQAAQILTDRYAVTASVLEVGRLAPPPPGLPDLLRPYPAIVACEDQTGPGALAAVLSEALTAPHSESHADPASGLPGSRLLRCDLTASPGSGDYGELLHAAGLTGELIAARVAQSLVTGPGTSTGGMP